MDADERKYSVQPMNKATIHRQSHFFRSPLMSGVSFVRPGRRILQWASLSRRRNRQTRGRNAVTGR